MGAMKVNLLMHINNNLASSGLSGSCQRFCTNLPRVYENVFLWVVFFFFFSFWVGGMEWQSEDENGKRGGGETLGYLR